MAPRKKTPLDLDTRRAIYEIVEQNPGLHLREIRRRTDLAVSAVEYHLRYLEEKELIISRTEGGFRRYYVEGKLGSKDKRILSALRLSTPRRIVVFLLLHPESTHQEIHRALGISASTLSYHLRRLRDADIVEEHLHGRSKSYSIKEEEVVARALIAHKSSFLDRVLDGFEEAWAQMHP